MRIETWPSAERPREKLIEKGPGALTDAELLALVVRTGRSGASALDIARTLLARHGGLRGLLECDLRAFCATPGVDRATYALLHAGLELVCRHLEARLARTGALESPADTRRYVNARLRGHPHEVFACLFLDNRHRVIRFEELFRGTIDGASVHPREVVKRALEHNAAALIVAHNHPSGVAEPSPADRSLTRRLSEATALVDVRLLDHLVVGDGEVVSFAERGWM